MVEKVDFLKKELDMGFDDAVKHVQEKFAEQFSVMMLNYHALKCVDSSFIDHSPRIDGSCAISRSVTSRGPHGR